LQLSVVLRDAATALDGLLSTARAGLRESRRIAVASVVNPAPQHASASQLGFALESKQVLHGALEELFARFPAELVLSAELEARVLLL
jgi:hypothetical protein